VSELFNFVTNYWHTISTYIPGFLKASLIVLELTAGTVLLSWAFGLIAALGKSSRFKILCYPSSFYIWFIRGTPTLIQIFIVYFGFPQLGLKFSPFVAGVLTLGVNSGAYVAEIIRAGLTAISVGQMESARALGMNYVLAMRRIILPQVVRIIIPPITNEAITMLKNTSLLSTITVYELTLYSQVIIARTFRPFDFYIIAAILYLAMVSILTSLSTRMEKRYGLAYEQS
jgi:His/Glu/Gln/Arg/opine family amino acid ABC transporter permease subunit